MFTGLIQEIGSLLSVQKGDSSLKVQISCSSSMVKADVGASIAVNGVCLTVISLTSSSFYADVMPETWRRTRLKDIKIGEKVNLEKSISLQTPMGGHFVYGDVDAVGRISNIQKEGIATLYEIELDPYFMRYVAFKGRVAIDGASLTVMKRTDSSFTVSLIPHSASNLILGVMRVGNFVNVETDVIAKYCEHLVNPTFVGGVSSQERSLSSTLTLNKLAENGFI